MRYINIIIINKKRDHQPVVILLYNMETYKYKYLKYKTKYENLLYQFGGVDKKVIIHISGPSGSGKTTLGDKLKDKFGNKIIVKDIDDLRVEFIEKYYGNKEWSVIDKKAYQKYIDNYMNNQNKPIIFVGLNNMPWWHEDLYYNMHSTYNYYIKIDDMTIVKQKCLRLFENMPNDKFAMNDLVNNNELFIELTKRSIDVNCNAKETIKMNKKWNKDYEKQGYKFMSRELIFKKVSKILDEILI